MDLFDTDEGRCQLSKYTPGPWYVERYDVMVLKPEREHLGEGAPETICEMISSVSPEETRCNQQLIAAAPELLEACKLIKTALERVQANGWLLWLHDPENCPVHETASERLEMVIAKAEGRAS